MRSLGKLAWLQQSIKIETDECIIWPFWKRHDGYGTLRYKGKNERATRVVLHLCVGFDLNSKLKAAHSCDNPPCVNKRHLYPATNVQNMHDAMHKGRLKRVPQSTCKRGHPFNESNTYTAPNGKRRCKTCRNTIKVLGRLIDAQTEKELDR